MEDYRKSPLWNNDLPVEERLDYLISQLTLEEKIKCLTTGCPDIGRLGIKASFMGGEAAHGIEARHDQAFNAGEPEPTTAFTQPIGMSASFDRELIRDCGRAVGEEARALFTRNAGGGLCRWAPTVDMERDPRWGRTEEAYGEDPCLTGEMASAYIRGMKGEDSFYLRCGATLKHFYANNVEKDRIKISSSLDLRNKYEYYLEPFRKAIEEGGAEAVMTSYNEINGVPAIVNSEVQKLLKDTYGLPGHVVCDGGDFQQTVNDHQYFKTHAETLAYGLKAGVDCFTDDAQAVYAAAEEALEKKLITEEDINRSIRNSFRTRIRLGFFDGKGDCPYTGMGEEFINNEEHQRLSAKMAEEAVVLLKNENGMLPLLPEKIKSMAVIGPMAEVWYKDWYCGIPPYSVTPLQGIKEAYPETGVMYESGLSDIYLLCNEKFVGLNKENRLLLTEKENAELFTYTDWGCGSATLVSKTTGKFVTLEENTNLIKADKKEAFGWFIRESWSFIRQTSREESAGKDNGAGGYLLKSWNGKQTGIDKEGFLAITEEEGALFTVEIVSDGIERAVAAAKNAEKAVIIIGSNPVINSKEEVDRTTLALPPAQERLTEQVLLANPETVVVLVSNYPYTIQSLQEKAPGILYTASGSQELGHGIASVLSGKVSPAGRLAMTWYRSDEDLPDMEDYDIIQGKRTYQYFDKEVLYPFGYGLSYTDFSYGEMSIKGEGEAIAVKLSVTNTGRLTGDEVVQLYVHKENSRVESPIKKLLGFERIKDIKPGETKEAVIRIKVKELKYFDVISQNMLLEEGVYTFMAGASSQDIRQKASLSLEQLSLKGETAPVRNPFAWTQAIRYDSYKNCFIHKGVKGHTLEEHTAVIPGKPGDAPDIVKEVRPGEKISCELLYRDFMFERQPKQVELNCEPLENGKIIFAAECQSGMFKEAEAEIRKEKIQDFETLTLTLPEDFIQAGCSCSIRIQIEGKIKLSGFCFI